MSELTGRRDHKQVSSGSGSDRVNKLRNTLPAAGPTTCSASRYLLAMETRCLFPSFPRRVIEYPAAPQSQLSETLGRPLYLSAPTNQHLPRLF
jgi:hypothetical protein